MFWRSLEFPTLLVKLVWIIYKVQSLCSARPSPNTAHRDHEAVFSLISEQETVTCLVPPGSTPHFLVFLIVQHPLITMIILFPISVVITMHILDFWS